MHGDFGNSTSFGNVLLLICYILLASQYNIGAVITGRHFRNPISLAKEIMKNLYHCALSGDGVLKFVKKYLPNIPTCEPRELITDQVRGIVSYEDFNEWIKSYSANIPTQECGQPKDDKPKEPNSSADTVSAVALDCHGHFACAMSTGARKFLLYQILFQSSELSLMICGVFTFTEKSGQ